MKITVSVNSSPLEPVARQVPYALALALSRTARDAQDEVRADLPHRFTIRTPYTVRGIRASGASKADLNAVVSAPDYMALQETGGTRTPARSRYLAIPSAQVIDRSRLVPRGMRPGASGTFVMRTKAGPGIAKRVGKRVSILHWLEATTPVAPRFGFGEQVAGVVSRRFATHFAQTLAHALATAR